MEAANPVDASGTVETGGPGTVVDVHRTVLSGPTVHAYAIVRSQRVGARGPVVAHARPHGAFVDVHLAGISGPLGGARARVTVHAVHARTAVETGVRYTVVNVFLAVFASEPCEKPPKIVRNLMMTDSTDFSIYIYGDGISTSVSNTVVNLDFSKIDTLRGYVRSSSESIQQNSIFEVYLSYQRGE